MLLTNPDRPFHNVKERETEVSSSDGKPPGETRFFRRETDRPRYVHHILKGMVEVNGIEPPASGRLY